MDYHLQIEEIWKNTETFLQDASKKSHTQETLNKILQLLNSGHIRSCYKENDQWIVNEWVKKAILLMFSFFDNQVVDYGPYKAYEKTPIRFDSNATKEDFDRIGTRIVCGALIRSGVFLGKGSVIMPSFINMGAYIGAGTMIDSMTTIGSCAQIGNNCHISSGVTIAGVLEPLANRPVIVEENCFIGAGSQISEGTLICEGSILGAGVILSSGTKIYDRSTKTVSYGKIPPYSVVVQGFMPSNREEPVTGCAIIVKTVDNQTRSKTSINEILRT